MRYFLNALFVLAILPAMPLGAAPLQYHLDLAAGSDPLHPLSGADLELDLTWDATALSPLQSSPTSTIWPVTNSIGSLTVTGSAAADGVYTASFATSQTLSWIIFNDAPGMGDVLRFPVMRFQINGTTVETAILTVAFGDTFFGGQQPFFPKPFEYSHGNWSSLSFNIQSPASKLVATVLDASVVAVPEPATLALGSFALLSLAALRRRK
jgi:hypothetical protein